MARSSYLPFRRIIHFAVSNLSEKIRKLDQPGGVSDRATLDRSTDMLKRILPIHEQILQLDALTGGATVEDSKKLLGFGGENAQSCEVCDIRVFNRR